MGNLAKGSPLDKKINFFCFLLDTSRSPSAGEGNFGRISFPLELQV